jgi:SAM-dependent methyltransferase
MSGPYKDYFSGHAADYRTFRPVYPPELFAFLASVSPGQRLAWDCGTGNGQAAAGLADHFDRVLATDASAQQVRQAPPHPKVEYAVAPAERCPLPDHAADLVIACQALHWFDFDGFHAEVRRVARPGGVLAVTCYDDPGVGREVQPVMDRWNATVGPFWPPERKWVSAGYRTVPFPFAELPAPHIELTMPATLPVFLGYLGTWSATKQFIRANGCDPVEQFAPEFASVWGGPDVVRTVRWEFGMRVGRVG